MFEKMKLVRAEPRLVPAADAPRAARLPAPCANVLLPPTRLDCDAGFVIMEQPALYAAMSGTNLMIVATVLLEDGDAADRRAADELTLEAPAGPDRGARALRRRPRDAGRVRQRAVVRDRRRRPDRRARLRQRCRSASPGAGWPSPWSTRDASASSSCPSAHATCRRCVAVCGAAREQIGFSHPAQPGLDAIEATVVIAAAARPVEPRAPDRLSADAGRWTRRRAAPARPRHGRPPRPRRAGARRRVPDRGPTSAASSAARSSRTRGPGDRAADRRSRLRSPATPATSSTRTTRSPRASRSATSGPRRTRAARRRRCRLSAGGSRPAAGRGRDGTSPAATRGSRRRPPAAAAGSRGASSPSTHAASGSRC